MKTAIKRLECNYFNALIILIYKVFIKGIIVCLFRITKKIYDKMLSIIY